MSPGDVKRNVVMQPHHHIRPSQQQGEVDAVLSRQDSHSLLSVLDVHTVDLVVSKDTSVEIMENIRRENENHHLKSWRTSEEIMEKI